VLIGQDGQQHFVCKIEQEFVSGFLAKMRPMLKEMRTITPAGWPKNAD
jgi:hypothetical protein